MAEARLNARCNSGETVTSPATATATATDAAADRPAAPRERIDWSQLWYPGPTRVFTDDEMARAGQQRPSRSFLMVLLINLAFGAQGLLHVAPPAEMPRLLALLLGAVWPVYRGAMLVWARPTRRRLMAVTLTTAAVFTVLILGLRWRVPDASARSWLFSTLAVMAGFSMLGFWFVAVFRSQQIAARLRELEERDHAVAMARQLATAQIQPHFLFNSLASLQHWVDSGDTRAAPMLRSLTGYLRATLPMFQRDALALGEELAAIERYLDVMQMRLGDRLQVAIEVDADVRDQTLPPGLLLTLVENAIEHGVLPSLQGAELRIRARRRDGLDGAHQMDRMSLDPTLLDRQVSGRVVIEVLDTGPGLPAVPQDGVGLANSRARLAQAWGDTAQLNLLRQPEGGTCARLDLPYQPLKPAA